MKHKTYRILRFNPISNILFNIKWIDYLLRRMFISNYAKNTYSKSSENALKINNELNPILRKYNGFLGHGIALSLIRDKKLPISQDLDYDIFNLNNLDDFINDMIKINYSLYLKGFYRDECKMLTFEKEGIYIDFFICKVIDNKYEIGTVCVEKMLPKFNEKNSWYNSDDYICFLRKMTYSKIKKYTINDNIFYLPKNLDLYFSELYGFDWKVPKKYFNWAINPKNNKPLRIKNGCHVIISKENFIKSFQ